MRGEIDFQKYSQTVGEGLFADNITLSILDYREKGKLDHKEKEALKRAREFFDNVIDGGNLRNSIFSSAHDVMAAKAFNSVLQIKPRLPKSKTITDYISELRDAIEEILNGNPVSDQRINQLDKFFTSYSRINFQKTESVLETV